MYVFLRIKDITTYFEAQHLTDDSETYLLNTVLRWDAFANGVAALPDMMSDECELYTEMINYIDMEIMIKQNVSDFLRAGGDFLRAGGEYAKKARH
jgi:hypothetical protein